MTNTHTTTTTTHAATDTGALDGHRVTCTCGMTWTTSLSAGLANLEAAKHLDWHAKAGK